MSKQNQELTGYPSIDKPWLKYYSDELINGNIPEQRVYDVMYERNKEHPDDIALSYYGKKVTYQKLFALIEKAASALVKQNIKQGDIVTLCMPSLPETIYIFYALNRIGAIANLIDPRYNPEKIKKLINETQSGLLFVIDVVADKIVEIEKDICCKKIVLVSPADSFPITLKIAYGVKQLAAKEYRGDSNKYIPWKKFIALGDVFPSEFECGYEKDAAVAIVYTGGTTGSPKGAIMTTEGLNSIVYHQKSCMPLVERQSLYLDIMPPFIAFGLTCGMNNPLCEGAILDLIPSFDHHKFDELLLKHKPNHVIGVPAFWEDLCNSKKAEQSDFSFLKSVIAGGDGMNEESEKRVNTFLAEHGCKYKLLKGYGMTEVSSCAAFTCTDESNKVGSVGIPLAKNNIKVVNPDTGEELSYCQKGELYIQTTSVMGEYYNNQIDTQASITVDANGDKWVKTSDIGYVDEDGCIFITDRIKNVIIRSDGFKVFPNEIEKYIMSCQEVSACKVVGISDEEHEHGMLPKAFIVLDKNTAGKESEIIEKIKEICHSHLPEYQVPVQFIVKEDLPLTAIGKIDVMSLQKE